MIVTVSWHTVIITDESGIVSATAGDAARDSGLWCPSLMGPSVARGAGGGRAEYRCTSRIYPMIVTENPMHVSPKSRSFEDQKVPGPTLHAFFPRFLRSRTFTGKLMD